MRTMIMSTNKNAIPLCQKTTIKIYIKKKI